MRIAALAFVMLIVAFGLIGMISPPRVVSFARSFVSPVGIAVAAGLRVTMGVVLYLAAPESRTPELLHVLGVITVLAGIGILFFGVDRLERMVDWWAGRSSMWVRAQASIALAAGLLLAWSLNP